MSKARAVTLLTPFPFVGPLFIFQWQYDQTQMIVENPATGMRGGIKTGKKLIGKLATDIKKSLNSTPVR